MINLADYDDKTLAALAAIMERDGNKEAAQALRDIVAKRERDRKELEELFRYRGTLLWRG